MILHHKKTLLSLATTSAAACNRLLFARKDVRCGVDGRLRRAPTSSVMRVETVTSESIKSGLNKQAKKILLQKQLLYDFYKLPQVPKSQIRVSAKNYEPVSDGKNAEADSLDLSQEPRDRRKTSSWTAREIDRRSPSETSLDRGSSRSSRTDTTTPKIRLPRYATKMARRYTKIYRIQQ